MALIGHMGNLGYTLGGADRVYRQLIETMSEGAVTLSADGAILYCNVRFAEILGRPLDQVLGTALRNYLPPADRQALDAIFAQARTAVARQEINLKNSEGRLVPVYLSASRLQGEGTEMVFCLVLTDLTEQKRQEQIVAAERLARLILEQVAEAIVVCDEQGRVIRASQAAQQFCDGNPLQRPFAEVVPLRTDASDPFNLAPVLQGETLRNVDVVLDRQGQKLDLILNAGPLLSGQQILGCVVILTDITERRRAEARLRENEERFRTLVENSTIGLYRTTPDGRIQLANPALVRMLGYSSFDDLSIRNLEEKGFEPLSPRTQFIENIEKDGEVKGLESGWKRKDGTTFFARESAHVIRDSQAKTLYYEGTVEDITERRRAEEALRAERALLRTLIDNLPDNVFIKDVRGGIVLNNLAHRRLLGRQELAEVVGKSDRDFFAPALADRYMDDERRIVESGRPLINYEEPVVDQEGRPYWYLTTKVPVRDSHGNITALVGINRDITERKRAEEDLKANEKKYRLLADNAQDVIFVLDMNLNYTYLSPSIKILRGFEQEEVLKQTPIEALTPSSRDLALRTLSEFMELEKSGRSDIPIFPTLQLEMIRKDGSTVWTEVQFSFIRDENQRPVGILGVTRDITERKQEINRVRKALGATVQAIAVIVETRDPYTAGHQRRVADLARAIAMEMNLPIDMIDGIRAAASIHDLGKISVPAEMLSKPTKLTDIEFRIIKTHSQSGYDILKDIEFPWPVARMVLEHHEKMNGSGYPNGLTGDKVLLESRILSVADVVEAMASHRPYRASLGIEAALNEISKNKGILYEPEVVDACLRLFHKKDYKIID